MDEVTVGRHGKRLGACVGARQHQHFRWAARSGWPCSPRSRPSEPRTWPPTGEPAAAALNSGYHLAYLTGAGLVLVAIAVAVSLLRARVPEGAPDPEPVPEVPAEPVPGAATEPEAPSFRVKPLPAYTEAQVAGCQETGMRVVIGCGGCAVSAP